MKFWAASPPGVCGHAPLCRRRRLTQVETTMWTGIPGTVLCHTYRCLGCGEKVFAERYGSPMTMADHAVWREAKQMRILEYPSGSEFPTAAVRRRGRRS